MSEVDLEAATQQALKQSQERASKTSAASPNVNFAVQLKSASNMTNAKLRESAASAGINATGQSVISAAVKARGQAKSVTQQSPSQVATQQKMALANVSTNSLAGNNKTTQTAPTATSVVGNTTTAANSTSDSVLSSTSSSTDSSSAALLQATNQMQEMNQQFNLQYLQLQENEQAQNRQFTSLSNVSKLRSDTAKNSISNLK